MPRTRARPPTRQNGTSAPRRDGGDEVVEAGPAQHRRGVGRAAAEPAAVRDPLVDVHAGACARRARSARATRLRLVDRHAVGVTARSTVMPSPSGSIVSASARSRRDHLGVDQVVAVVAHAGDRAASSVSLAGAINSIVTVDDRPRRVGQPAPLVDVQLLGRAASVDAGGVELARQSPRRPATGAASCGAARTPCAPARTASSGATSPAGRGGRSRRAPTRRSDGARTPTAGTTPTMRAVAQYATFTLTAPYAREPGAGDEPLGRPRAAPSRASARSPARRRAGRTPAAWPRCTAGWRRAPTGRAPPSSCAQSSVIASASTTVTSATSATTSRSTATMPRSTSTAVTVGAGLGQRQRQRAEPGADLDDVVAGTDAGEAGDAPHRVGVGDEVLAEVATRRQPVVGEELVDRRRADQHDAGPMRRPADGSATATGASARSAIATKASVSHHDARPAAGPTARSVVGARRSSGRCRRWSTVMRGADGDAVVEARVGWSTAAPERWRSPVATSLAVAVPMTGVIGPRGRCGGARRPTVPSRNCGADVPIGSTVRRRRRRPLRHRATAAPTAATLGRADALVVAVDQPDAQGRATTVSARGDRPVAGGRGRRASEVRSLSWRRPDSGAGRT